MECAIVSTNAGGVVLSRQRKLKKLDIKSDKINLNYQYLFYDSLRWNWVNYKISKFLKNKKSVKIEDLLKNPQMALLKLGGMMNVQVNPKTAINTDNEFIIEENHLIHGNRFRFTRGAVKLTEDMRWKKQLKKRDNWLLEKISWFKFPTTTNIKNN